MIKKVSALTERIREAWAAQEARLPRGGKLSQSAIARYVGVAGSTILRWRSGPMEPDAEQIVALAEALEVSHHWLAFGDGEMRGAVSSPSAESAAAGGDASGGTGQSHATPRRRKG